jgi:hypothetical protein
MSDAEAIADKLTKAQRKAVLGKTRWLTHRQSLEWPMCGTVCRGPHNTWQATNLGLRVRDVLLARENGGE